eukprot:TRINITY_DN8448_c0_g1_i2.p1 TRINITY_DN8448_c0_g1~~TRINITY_DN8448_c0_g1_i2.p1  ORF type:complete len:359 (+),score=54.61 TRINITY_DN8448_c0_g1_i2:482-1558(+)
MALSDVLGAHGSLSREKSKRLSRGAALSRCSHIVHLLPKKAKKEKKEIPHDPTSWLRNLLQDMATEGDTAFRVAERAFKLRNGAVPDLSGVLRKEEYAGKVWVALEGKQGAFFLPGFLEEREQIQLVRDALCRYPDENEGHDSNLRHDGKQRDKKRRRLTGGEGEVLHDKELRWVTLGYAYDWTEKSYDKEKSSKFPEDLKELVQRKYASIRTSLGLPPVEFQTAIVNYYNAKSTLMGHTDSYEDTSVLHRPLLTLSLGRSAVFLVGGLTKNTPPVPILIQSGDAVILSGPSRLAYHGIPSILPDTCPKYITERFPSMANHRVNVSLRQVFTEATRIQEEDRESAAEADCDAAHEVNE